MPVTTKTFQIYQRTDRAFTPGDGVALAIIAVGLYAGARLAFNAPPAVAGTEILLVPSALPWYVLLSLGRMLAAYTLALLFTLVYGRAAASSRLAEGMLMPLLDVLQSVPILSFLPVVLLSVSTLLPQRPAAEITSIVLIFTSQAWNLTFSWYQSLTTLPKELREASAIFRLNAWMRFKMLELPFAAISLVWNSMVSWSGGWFFLMAAEIFTVGTHNFRLPGLGAYLSEAANRGNYQALALGMATLILTIILLDQLVWRPLLTWTERFKIEMIESDDPPTSWFYEVLHTSRLAGGLKSRLLGPLAEALDGWLLQQDPRVIAVERNNRPQAGWMPRVLALGLGAILLYELVQAGMLLIQLPFSAWVLILQGVLATLGRVAAALLMALAWTIPVGVAIGTNRRLATILQPLVQITASIPATALFPVLLVLAVNLPGGLDLAAILLMLMGTQWYLLFNIIAGASAIPQDLKYTAALIHLSGWERWRTLILPAIFPYLITGLITASGGAWNASIVAEYQSFGGQVLHTPGIGALISQATAAADYPLLLAATLSMVLAVVLVNRLVWRRFYKIAAEKYRME